MADIILSRSTSFSTVSYDCPWCLAIIGGKLAHAQDLFGLNPDIGPPVPENRRRLVIRMRELGERSACLSRRPPTAAPPWTRIVHADRGHVRPNELHGVVNRHASRDRTARRVDIDVDILFGIFCFEEEELSYDKLAI